MTGNFTLLLVGLCARGAAAASRCQGEVHKDLLYGAAEHWDTADWICCHNTHWAEPRGFADGQGLYALLAGHATPDRPVVFYDSVCPELPLFVAPVGRSFARWRAESEGHGWPSFRPDEATEHVTVLPSGRMESACGTHLGHNLPDGSGNRYCINLVSVAGRPKEEAK